MAIQDLPHRVLGTGEVIVDVVAAPILSYAGEVFSGARGYLLQLPVVPGAGAVGRVRAIGPGATRLAVGDWVLCDPPVRSRDAAIDPDITLQGPSAPGKGGLQLRRHFLQGSFAQRMMVPTENAVRIGSITEREAVRWCAVNTLLAPYGGLLAAKVQADETVLISGATGHFWKRRSRVRACDGSRACHRTMAQRECTRRSEAKRDRVRVVKLSGDEEADRKAMQEGSGQPIDCVLDILRPSAGTAAVKAAMVRPALGRVVLMGGVGMLGGPRLEIPHAWIMRNNISLIGQRMYEREAVHQMVALVRSGLIDLDQFTFTEFTLDHVNEAVTHAATTGGPFAMTVLRP